MTTAIVSEKGQLTLPAAIRKKAHIQPGTRVEIDVRDGEIVLRPLKRLSEFAGVFHYAAANRVADQETIRTEMEEAIAREVTVAYTDME